MQKFCPQCDNQLFERTNPTSLTLTCRNCNYECEAKELRLISYTRYGQEHGAFDDRQLALLARNAVDDPTLQRVTYIACPSPKCPAARDGRHETIIYEYDGRGLLFVYVCTRCNHAWRGGKQQQQQRAAADEVGAAAPPPVDKTDKTKKPAAARKRRNA